MSPLELLRWHTIILQKTFLNYPYLHHNLALWLTLSGSSLPCLEQMSTVPKVFEPLKLDAYRSYQVLLSVIVSTSKSSQYQHCDQQVCHKINQNSWATYPCLKQISMVLKLYEPLKLDYMFWLWLLLSVRSSSRYWR